MAPLLVARPQVVVAADVTVTRLDGSTVTGELQNWDEHQLVVKTSAGEERLTIDQLTSLRWPAPASAEKPGDKLPGVVELTDGSQIPIGALRVAGDDALLKVERSAEKGDAEIKVPAKSISTVRFQKLDGALVKQWDEIRNQKSPSDVLIIIKRDGKSLDYVEGIVGEITDDKVEFKLDGETNRIDRAKVAGVIYYHRDRARTAETKFILHGRSGLQASSVKLAINEGMVDITTAGGVSLRWPIDDLEAADFSAGKVMYLSDMNPASQSWTPLVGLPEGVTLAAEYGQPRRDRSAFSNMLTLPATDKSDAASQSTAIQTFKKGLALRSRSELVYRVPDGFNRFTALAGIDPVTTSTGNVRLSILADDRSLLEADIAGNQPPQPIDVQLNGAKRLKIIVDFGQNLDTGDWLNLCDAKIAK
ncbi:MAG TPA: NPCBM/NEW2 domain-containing protein [Lacipirellulaceae bacterium]|nr:NPCBM/NEW2 domain-containing protein [Lacipirellulaceae bacterium]